MKKWLVEGLLFTLYLLFGLSWLAYAPLSGPLQDAFHINETESGMLISSVSLANAFVPILAGWLGARTGLYRGIGLGALLCGTAALSPWVSHFPSAVLLRFGFGLGGGIVATLMGPMTMRWFPPKDWATINGYNNVSVNVGITLAMYCTLPLSHRWGWQNILTGYGSLAAVAALLWWVLAGEGERELAGAVPDVSVKEILRRPETWWFTIGFAGPLASFLALNTWLLKHLVHSQGMDEESAAHLLAWLNLIGLPAAPLGGWATTRLGLRRPLVLACGLLLPLFSVGLLWAPHPYVWATLLGLVFLFYLAPFFTMPMELAGATPQSVGLMTGAVLSLAYLLAFGSPMAVGWLGDRYGDYGTGLGLTIFGLLSGSLALGGWFLPETGRRSTG